MRSIGARTPNALLVNETHPKGLRWGTRSMDDDLKELHDKPPRLGGSVLIIQDINERAGQSLLTEFGHEVSPEFLARHMIRLDSQSAIEHAKSTLDSSPLVRDRFQGLKVEDRLLFALTSPLSKDTNGFHVDCDFSSVVQSPSAWGTTHVVTTTRFTPEVSVSIDGVMDVSVGFGDYGASNGISDSYASVGAYSLGASIGDVMGISGYAGVNKTKEVKMQKTRTHVSCCQLEDDFCEARPICQQAYCMLTTICRSCTRRRHARPEQWQKAGVESVE